MVQMGAITKIMLTAAFGAAIASQMKTNTMVMFSAMAASAVGANAVFFTDKAVKGVTATGYVGAQAAGSAIMTTGQPISAVMAGVIAVLFGKLLSGKTLLDMVIVPAATTIVGTVSGYYLAAVTTPALVAIGKFIASSVAVNPIIGTAIVAMAFGAMTMTPASAAALAVAIGATGVTSPEAAGAILIGTTAVFVRFPTMSFHENKIGAAIAAPIATIAFNVTAPFSMAGIGFNSFIVPLALAGSNPAAFAAYMIIGVGVPVIVSFVGYRFMRKMGWAKPQQLHLEMI